MPNPPVTPAESESDRLHGCVDWIDDYGSRCRSSVIAERQDPCVSLMFFGSGFTATPPSLPSRAARELAAALIAAADLIEGQGAQS